MLLFGKEGRRDFLVNVNSILRRSIKETNMYYRRLPPFDYLAPATIKDACALLEKHPGETRVMAGGTIVLHRMKERVATRKYLMSLKSIKDLNGITFNKTAGLRIGAMASLQAIADSAVVKEKWEPLSAVCAKLGTPQIRSMGTLGGNLASRFATAETVPALIALGAEAELVSAHGEKSVPVESLYKELKDGELLTEIRIPVPAAGTRGGCQKFAMREKFDYATVSAVVVVTLVKGVCQEVKIGLGGVTLPTMRAKKAEEIVRGKMITDELIEKAGQTASEEGQTGADLFFSAEYKKELLKVMVKKALKQALA